VGKSREKKNEGRVWEIAFHLRISTGMLAEPKLSIIIELW
jgi:hypothetical protein